MERYVLSPDLFPKRMARLWLHQHQFQRFLIGFGSVNHMILATFRLMIDLLMLSEAGRPQAQMTVRMWWYEAALWLVTNLLFRRSDRFFCFRRPRKAYQFSVYAIIFAAPVPLLVMHIWTIVLAAGYDRKYGGRLSFKISLWTAVAALVTLLPIHGLYIRMARRFLLADSDAEYEPTRPARFRDDPPPAVSSSSSSSLRGQCYLHDAWAASLRTGQPSQNTPAQTTTLESQTPAAGGEAAANATVPPEPNTDSVMASSTEHCPATGYVDAMPYALRGSRAWMRYPLLYTLLAFYMTFLTWKMIAIIREKKMEPQLKYDHPYRPLCLCLSGYALCLYSSNNFIRRSTFAKREPKPPSSLIQIQGHLGPAAFLDPNASEPISVENEHMADGVRIHPAQHNGLASQTTGEPPLRSCRSHLGHLGHGFIASRRYIPVLCRISIIFLIFLYYHRGERYLIADSNPKLPGGLPFAELTRLMGKRVAITGATLSFISYNAPVRILVLIYAVQAVVELVYEQIVSLKSISGAAAEQVHDVVQQTEQAD